MSKFVQVMGYLLGGLLCLTIIGAPIGIPIVIMSAQLGTLMEIKELLVK